MRQRNGTLLTLPRSQSVRSPARRYGLAIGASLLALLIAHFFHGLFMATPSTLFFAVIVVSALYGGFGPGALATVIGAAAILYFFLAPTYSFSIADLRSVFQLAIFAAIGFLTSFLSGARMRAEEGLRQSRDQLAAILQGVTDGITVQEASGKVIYANDAAARYSGYASAEAMLAATPDEARAKFDIMDEAGEPIPLARLPGRRALLGEQPPETMLRFRAHEGGEEHWSIVQATPIFDGRGAVRFAINIFRDITESRKAEMALRASEQRFRSLIEKSSDAIALIDAEGIVQYAGPSSEEVLGYAAEELVGRSAFDLIHPDDRERTARFLGALAGQPGASATTQYRLRRKDGSWRWFEGTGTNLLDDPTVGAIVGNYRDITERRRSEEAQRFLAEASALLASSLDYETTLQRVAQLAVPHIADWCAVELIEGDTFRPVTVAHMDPAKVAMARGVRERYPPDPAEPGGIPEVARSRQAVLVPEITDAMLIAGARDEDHLRVLRALGMRSVMIVPLVARDAVVGTLSFVAAESGRQYDDADLALAQELARRAAIAVDNARLYHDAQDARERFRTLFAGVGDAVVVLSPSGHYLDANPALTALLGYTVAELRQMRVGDLSADPEQARRAHQGFEEAGVWRGESEWRRKDGTIVPVEGYLTTVSLPSGPVYLGTWRDI
ncbi:MAG: PAS domain S-box protein, partial [Thermomicrobiales bacterium]